jgi:GNAT superfamily N-acetyltransferase
MNARSTGSVIQGVFRPGAIVQMTATRQPGRPAAAAPRRVPTFQDLTLQAHMRSAGVAAQPAAGSGVIPLPPHQVPLHSRQGQPLPEAVREKMESYFKTDFSGVRVHVGPEAAAINALAFTEGSNLYFAPGQYDPRTPCGQQLIGHELTHVVQQRAGRVRNPLGAGVVIVRDPALEAEAERMGTHAAAHQIAIQPRMAPPVNVSRLVSGKNGEYKFVAGTAAQPAGTISLHNRRGPAVELTHLGVDPAHRSRGLGPALIATALRAGLRLGKKLVRLHSDDNGTGRLTRWYKSMGFRQTGVNVRGHARMEAPIGRVLNGVAQARRASSTNLRSMAKGGRIVQLSGYPVAPGSYDFAPGAADEAVKALPHGAVPSATSYHGGQGVEEGGVASYAIIQYIEKVGDMLTGDHQPSGAAVKEALRQALHGAKTTPLTRLQARNAYKKAVTIVVTDDWHKKQSRTYGGRNSSAVITADAADLILAAKKDFDELSAAWLALGWTQAEVDNAWNELHDARVAFFKTGQLQAGSYK